MIALGSHFILMEIMTNMTCVANIASLPRDAHAATSECNITNNEEQGTWGHGRS